VKGAATALFIAAAVPAGAQGAQAPAATEPPPAAVPVQSPERIKAFQKASPAIFAYGRALAFRQMARERHCPGSVHAAEAEALSRRIDAAARRLQRRHGFFFDGPDEPVGAVECDEWRLGITMRGYRNAVGELEAVAR
jgi:hypothetical protein